MFGISESKVMEFDKKAINEEAYKIFFKPVLNINDKTNKLIPIRV